MQDFVNSANVPQISHAIEHRYVVEMIKRWINHSNFNVVLWDLREGWRESTVDKEEDRRDEASYEQ